MTHNPSVLLAPTATDLLAHVLDQFVTEGSAAQWERSTPRGMQCREIRNAQYVLLDPTRCAAWLPGRKLNYPFMVGEFVWIFCGRDDLEMIGYYNEKITAYSDDGATFFGAYGPRWRGQIEGVVARLQEDPDTRQAVVCIWRPEYNDTKGLAYDSPATPGLLIKTKDVPCTLTMQYMLRNGRLEASVVMRSSDAWLGLPYDIFNFAMLQRAVAKEVGKEAGPLSIFIGNSHLYARDVDRAEEVTNGYDLETGYVGLPQATVEVPNPPGIDCGLLEATEEGQRKGGMPFKPAQGLISSYWNPFLSVLDYRRHKDVSLVLPPFDALVRP